MSNRLQAVASHTYEGVEDLARFPDRAALERYREGLLSKTAVHVYEDDAIEPRRPFPQARADAVICITGAFGYFDALSPGSDLAITKRFAAALRPGGTLILELCRHPAIVARCRVARCDRAA